MKNFKAVLDYIHSDRQGETLAFWKVRERDGHIWEYKTTEKKDFEYDYVENHKILCEFFDEYVWERNMDKSTLNASMDCEQATLFFDEVEALQYANQQIDKLLKTYFDKKVANSLEIVKSSNAGMVKLREFGVKLFGDETTFAHWLSTPSPLLDHKTPCSFMGSHDGIKQIEEAMLAIAGGVYT